jgi:hypothetical protein
MTSTIRVQDPPTHPHIEPGPRLLTDPEVAHRLGVHVVTLRTWRRQGYGPPVIRVGRYPRCDPKALEAWLSAQQETPEDGSR